MESPASPLGGAVLSYFFDNLATRDQHFTEVANRPPCRPATSSPYATASIPIPSNPNSGTNPTLIATRIPATVVGHRRAARGAASRLGTAAANGLAANVAHVYAVPAVDSSNLNHFVNITAPVPFTEPRRPTAATTHQSLPTPPNLPRQRVPADPSLPVPAALDFSTCGSLADANGDPLQFRFDLADPLVSLQQPRLGAERQFRRLDRRRSADQHDRALRLTCAMPTIQPAAAFSSSSAGNNSSRFEEMRHRP